MEHNHTAACIDRIEADRFLTQVHIPSAHEYLMGSCVTQTIQALIYGSAFSMVYYHFQRPRRDSRLERLGLIYLCFMCLVHLVMCNYQTLRIVSYSDQFTAVIFIDFWLFSLGTLIKTLITVPVLIFFSWRAHVIWNRRKAVFATCLLFDLVGLVSCAVSVAHGLKAPWGLRPVTTQEFYYWAPTLGAQVVQLRVMAKVAIAATFVNVCVISILICYGIYRHRNGFREMDNAISKIVFICSESLLPVVLIILLDVIAIAMPSHPVSVLLSRAAMQLAPPIYFYGLVLSLVSRERVAIILSAEPVRQMAPFASSTSSTCVTSAESCMKTRRRRAKRLGICGRSAHTSNEAIYSGSRARQRSARESDLGAEEAGVGTVSLLYSSVPGLQSMSGGQTESTDGPKTPAPARDMRLRDDLDPDRAGHEGDLQEKEAYLGRDTADEKPAMPGMAGDADGRDSVCDFSDMLRNGPPDPARRKA